MVRLGPRETTEAKYHQDLEPTDKPSDALRRSLNKFIGPPLRHLGFRNSIACHASNSSCDCAKRSRFPRTTSIAFRVACWMDRRTGRQKIFMILLPPSSMFCLIERLSSCFAVIERSNHRRVSVWQNARFKIFRAHNRTRQHKKAQFSLTS
jgi:hypothetical protein